MTSSTKTKKGEIALLLLKGIGIVGLLIVAVAAPNALQIVKIFQKRQRYTRQSLDQSLRKLKKRGLVIFVRTKRGWRVELTEKGQQELFLYEMKQKLLNRPRCWDSKWHLLIFDIQEERRGIRDAIRRTLVSFGFYRLQDSVWVFPYECEEVLELLRTKYHVRHEALYIAAHRIAKDESLRAHFGLKK